MQVASNSLNWSVSLTAPIAKGEGQAGKLSLDGGAVYWHAILAINNVCDYLKAKIFLTLA